MKQLLVKPIVMVLLLIVVPTVLLTVFQLNSLNQQEENFERIYQRQLKSVIFSLNMYADDVVGQWVSKISVANQTPIDSKTKIFEFIKSTPQIKGVLLYPYKKNNETDHTLVVGDIRSGLIQEIQDSCKANTTDITRLFTYLQNNYQKVVPFSLATSPQYSAFVFATSDNDGNKWLGSVLVDTEKFLIDLLVPRIQSTAQQDMAIAIKNIRDDSILYANNKETEYDDSDINETLWQLPHYAIYLKPLGNTAEALMNKRSRNNLWLLIMVDLVLLIGAVLIYANVRKQLQLAKIKADFVSNVSHEIRTPLALISMYAESLQLKRVSSEEKLQRSYQVIYRESRRLSGIVNNILNFSKMESGKRKFRFDTFDLNENIRQVLGRYQYATQANDVEFILNIDKTIPNAWGDKEAVDEVLANLIDNAIKYSKNQKYVEITTGAEDDMVWVEVKDRGIGIPQKEQALIFNQFYRVTVSNLAQEVKGSGLGLNIVKKIVHAHNGSVSVQSQPGKGSAFKIYLPSTRDKL
ncbi:two-component system, OmpR family, phosphate regulon sensor histidine kinase PhoR [Saccharicrinis carchari]|uniref:histidine kinase n=1 Tax=Saccharicrinis carchari TaxID=1168039 RepID=A0A521DP99_SACCC|nr:HAMP domain-containing sensor histidine kinase [Saccharicrinis carchari]SMO72911.1 two-component system, OmpR family, phosphate regulon sensor histidine kinase PhoR [Saccharicrinis carchari]